MHDVCILPLVLCHTLTVFVTHVLCYEGGFLTMPSELNLAKHLLIVYVILLICGLKSIKGANPSMLCMCLCVCVFPCIPQRTSHSMLFISVHLLLTVASLLPCKNSIQMLCQYLITTYKRMFYKLSNGKYSKVSLFKY